jgi:hypothetical protein
MKKLFALLIAAGMLAFVSCGGGKDKEKEKARLDSLKKDSIAKVQADSIKKVKEADSLKCAMKCDSLKKDSCEKAKKGGKDKKVK